MIDDAGQEIELGMWYRLLEEKQDLLAEVKRLRRILHIAEQNIPRRIHWDCYIDALIEEGFEKGDDEE